MKVVFFINKSHGFLQSMIPFLEESFPQIEKVYYTVDRRNEEKLPPLKNVHRIGSYFEFVFNEDLKKNIKDADKIIVSGVFTIQYALPIFGEKVLEKVYWQFWGGDYECFRLEKVNIARKLNKRIIAYCVKRAKGIILLIKFEREHFEEVFGTIGDNKYYFVPVPSGKDTERTWLKIRNEESEKNARRIAIGNSATETNRHLSLFARIEHLDLEGVQLVCPLSYGEPEYREKILSIGKEKFGENFVPITKYMDYENYVRLLNSCQVGIYNHNRQQSLGNISLMLNLGKKVYAPDFICSYFQESGYRIFPIDRIETESIDEVFRMSDEDRQQNMLCHDKRKQAVFLEWNRILMG